VRQSQAVVVNQNRPEFRAALQGMDGRIAVIDLVRLDEKRSISGISTYWGISW